MRTPPTFSRPKRRLTRSADKRLALSSKYGCHLLHQNHLQIKLPEENYHQRAFKRGRENCLSTPPPPPHPSTSRRLCCWASCLLAVCSGNYNPVNPHPPTPLSSSYDVLQVMPRLNSDSTRGSPNKLDQTWKAMRNRGKNGELSLWFLFPCCYNTVLVSFNSLSS